MGTVSALIILASLSTSLQQTPSLDAKLTLDYRATRVERLLQDLGPKCGIELSALEPMKQEVVILRCQDRPAKEILDRLAEALHAEWEVKEGRSTLKRSKETQKALDEIAFSKKVEALKPQIEAYERELKALPTPYERAKATLACYDLLTKGIRTLPNAGETADRSAALILLHELTAGLGAEGLARLTWGHAVTLANDPTPSELPFNAAQAQAVGEYAQTMESFAAIAKDDKSFPDPLDREAYLRSLHAAQLFTGAGKVLLGVNWTPGRLGIGVYVYSKEGQLLQSAFSTLNTDEGFAPFAEDAVSLPSTDRKLVLDGLDHELQAILSEFPETYYNNDMPGPKAAISPDLRRALMDPSKSEPLSFGTTQATLGAYADGNGPFLAVIPDDLYRCTLQAFRDGKVDLGVFRKRADECGMRVEMRAEWTLVAPEDPAHCEWLRLSRASLGKMMRSAVADRKLTLRNQCKMFFESAPAVRSSWVSRTFMFLMPGLGVERTYFDMNYPEYGFLGSLSDLQWKHLFDGKALDASTFTPDQQVWFRDLVAYEMPPSKRTAAASEAQPSSGQPVPDLYYHGPEWMPRGIPKGTLVQMEFGSKPILQLIEAGSPNLFKMPEGFAHDADSLVDYAYNCIRAKKASSLDEALSGKWRLGSREVYRLVIRPPHGIVIENACNGFKQLDNASPLLTFADWPEAVRDAVKSGFDDLMKRFGGD